MHEKYFLKEKKNYLTTVLYQEDMFFTLLQSRDVDFLLKQKDFLILTNTIKANLQIKDVFEKIAIPAVINNKMRTMQFLLEDCGFKELVKLQNGDKQTLLHLAAKYSGEELFELLLRHGADPNAKDIDEEVPLHELAKVSGKASFVEMLKSYQANVDVISKDGYTPLLIAALFQHTDTIAKLLHLGANAKIEKNGKNYIGFLKSVRQGNIRIQLDLDSSRLQLGNEDKVKKIFAKFYVGCLYPECNTQIFQKFLSLVEKHNFSSLDDHFRKLIVDACMFAFSMDFHKINEFFLKNFKNNKFVVDDLVLMLLKVCLNFMSENDYSSAAGTAKFLYSTLRDTSKKSLSMAVYFNEICFIFNKLGLHLYAELAGNYGLAFLADKKNNAKNKEIKAFLYYNIANTKKCFLLYAEALEKYKKAREFLPNDTDITEAIFNVLMLMGKYHDIISLSQNCTISKDYAGLIALHAKLQIGEVDINEVIITTENNFSEISSQIYALDLQATCYIQQNNFDKALEVGRKSFEISVRDNIEYSIGDALVKMLRLYLENGQYVNGLTFLQEQLSRYPRDFEINPMLMSFTIAMYTANHKVQEAEIMIERLLCTRFEKKVLSKLYVLLAIDNINYITPDYKNAQRYLDLALALDPHSLGAILYQPLVAILENNNTQYESVKTEIDTELLAQVSIENDLLKEKPLEPKLEIDKYDPIKIHAFFQAKKQEEFSNFLTTAYKSHKTTKWWVNEKFYHTEMAGLVSLNSTFYPGYYAMIKPDINVDKETLMCFQMALEKGICSRQFQSNGVKFLKTCLVELKIDGDKRLFTRNVYRNLEGKSLVLFDNVGNHKQINRILCDKKPLSIISAPSVSPGQFVKSQACFFNTKSIGKIPYSNDNNVPHAEIMKTR